MIPFPGSFETFPAWYIYDSGTFAETRPTHVLSPSLWHEPSPTKEI